MITWVRPHADKRSGVAIAAPSIGLVGRRSMRVMGETGGARGAGYASHLA